MKNSNLRIITFGVFDAFHIGHLNLFENIKKKFGYDCFLIVCVQSSENILKYKPNTQIFYDTAERVRIIKSLRCVDEVLIYDDVDIDILQIDFDIFVKGPDQNHQGFQNAVKYCEKQGKMVYTIQRTKNISSTLIKTSMPRTPDVCSTNTKSYLAGKELSKTEEN